MTKAVFKESELKVALKGKETQIEIIGFYADTVINKYGSYLTGHPPSPWTLMISGEPFIDMMIWQRTLLFYEVERYQKGELLKIRKSNLRW